MAAQAIPKTTKQWTVSGQNGFDSLQFGEVEIPPVGDNQVLVKLHAASLNYRDIVIPQGLYHLPLKDNVVLGSDGAGEVVAVGRHVDRLKTGDRVATLFNQGALGGPTDTYVVQTGLGGSADGTLRQYGAFDQNGLVKLPDSLSFREGAALPCAALTAWNALYGISDKALKPGQWVLTQGTGGVSIFTVQFAKAAGARVVSTTSSPERAALLERLGADHIINYRDTPDWGAAGKKFTPDGAGFDHIIDVGGPPTMKQSLEAVKIDGVITIVGFLGGIKSEDQPSFIDVLKNLCIVRGVLVGNRVQMEDMMLAIEANLEKLRPVLDPRTFSLEQTKEALEYMQTGKHQAKIVIDIE